ncbi:hypothetical protein ADIARSV_0509 [Arcticibacter svalbardensis MN12-7]|uniref:cAMP-binding protein n=1 Tax=Arcticibacter svalbardensis MN12-7 TaxID=1150600 RepID=R9H528_9SPHI|nr:hypothetical protein [Arcticibacter svalbardensis]EOR96274.1 hypothetical protein ADIARSV_0509 [Arcticibacter svalbardensis MN12-7]
MKFSNFLKKLSRFGTLSAELSDILISELSEYQFERGDLLVNPREVKKHEIYYIEKGMVRGCDNYRGKRISIWIAGRDSLLTVQNLKGRSIFIEQMHFLLDTTLYVLDLEKVLKHISEYPEMTSLLANILYQSILEGKQREHLLRLYPEDKVHYMEKNDALAINSTNLEAIASYLNLSRRHFIRIRSKIPRRKDF